MTPYEAAAVAAELHAHMLTLADLDLRPVANSERINMLRIEAQDCADILAGYLNTSDAFAPVIAS